MKIESNYKTFLSRKSICKCRLQNVDHFALGSMWGPHYSTSCVIYQSNCSADRWPIARGGPDLHWYVHFVLHNGAHKQRQIARRLLTTQSWLTMLGAVLSERGVNVLASGYHSLLTECMCIKERLTIHGQNVAQVKFISIRIQHQRPLICQHRAGIYCSENQNLRTMPASI